MGGASAPPFLFNFVNYASLLPCPYVINVKGGVVDWGHYDLFLDWLDLIWTPEHEFAEALADESGRGFYCGATVSMVGIVPEPEGRFP